MATRAHLRAVKPAAEPVNPFAELDALIAQRDYLAAELAAAEQAIATAMIAVRATTADYERKVRGRLA